VRPESLRLGAENDAYIPGKIQLRTFVGDRLEYEVTLPDGHMIHVEEPYMVNTPVWNEGDRVGIIVSAADVVALAN
jgi:ABC-type Fe3+/spermidine/putrescine transport system ATPase subunit